MDQEPAEEEQQGGDTPAGDAPTERGAVTTVRQPTSRTVNVSGTTLSAIQGRLNWRMVWDDPWDERGQSSYRYWYDDNTGLIYNASVDIATRKEVPQWSGRPAQGPEAEEWDRYSAALGTFLDGLYNVVSQGYAGMADALLDQREAAVLPALQARNAEVQASFDAYVAANEPRLNAR